MSRPYTTKSESRDRRPVALEGAAAKAVGGRTCGLALVMSLLFAGSSLAQARRTVEVPRHGVEVFANLLHEQGLKPLQGTEDLAKVDPAKTVIVVFGRLDELENIERAINQRWPAFLNRFGRRAPRGLSHFLNSGGALLIASDYPDRGRLASLGLGISGLPVYQHERFSFLGRYPSCPVLGVGPDFNAPHPVFRDLEKSLVTMRPSTFSFAAGYWRSVAWYPEQAFTATRRNVQPVGARESWMLASPLGVPGQALVVAGHGIFMNCFLVRQDHDNFLFARNVVRHLGEGRKGARTHVLFVQQGVTGPKLDLSLDPRPLPLGFLLNTVVDQLQRQGQPERFLQRNVAPTTTWRWLLIVATGLAVPLVCRRLLLTRFRRDTSAALVVGVQEKPPPPLPLDRQRQDEILGRRNFAEPARALARQWLREQGLAETSALPPYELHASWWRKRGLEKSLRWLASLVGQDPLAKVTPRQLRRIAKSLSELTRACRAGEIQFVSTLSAPKKD